jgi:hypothetical protein
VPDPPALHAHALDTLRYIRDAMERAGAFTGVPGWGGVWMGASALGAAAVAGPPAAGGRWVAVWLADAALASTIALIAIVRKARRSSTPLLAGPAQRFALAFLPPIAAGAALTPIFIVDGRVARLPGVWLLLYGAGVTAGGALSVRVIPMMGACFMGLGAVAFVSPAAWGNAFMALGFGAVHVAFGLIIVRRYGG